ncbi:SDR family oxidoreductase [Streptomyces sp. PTM05]|uniref:SDR family oxidoreductase n=1 Tax=Streptantibioticus parmotrematis TaxID=2873249 RepID=A0ABS7QK35_9ACTN|nr:SDR family oxidoreductase [Streptantibioticus parmotrematis]MBY8883528.1 SDR family oxidoreductase [Streptantibioticus parmotrematis]
MSGLAERTGPVAVRRRTVVSAGVPLAVYEQGDAHRTTVLLVHGYPDTHRVWDDVADELARDHHVVRYDVRGAGASGRPQRRADYRLPLLAGDLFAVVDAVSPGEAVHVVAHDWGSIQSWEAVTEPGSGERIASYTSLSGPCLDHVALWIRHRLARPTPRHVGQLLTQAAHSWYITAFHLPALAPAAWRLGLADRWGGVLRRIEGVTPRPGHPQSTLADDAVRGITLYRANMLPRLARPRQRPTDVPVQLITLTKDHYVSPALSEGLERWAPRLWRRTVPATHWSALLEKGTTVARMVREFTGHLDGEPAAPGLDRAGRGEAEHRPFAGKLAVVTGAGSGIGRATALAFAERGADVAVCDLDLEAAERTVELARLLGANARAWRVDVSDGAAVDTFATEVAAGLGVPDIVVNNAGIGHSGTFLDTTEKEWKRVLDVNLWGVIHGCRAFGTLMRERGEGGHIVNLASAAAYLPSKVLAAYATSKAGVFMLSDCLRAELAPSGIGVSAICPGIVNTNITRTTTFSGLSDSEQDARRKRVSGLYAKRNYPPEKVAEQILRAVSGNKAVVPVTFEAKAARFVGRLSPGLLRLAARVNAG